jgi:hypothetical protein
MEESITKSTTLFTPCASLAALGCYLQHIQLFAPIQERVQIGQKTVKHAPIDKLYDAWIAMLAGRRGWWRLTHGCGATWRCNLPLAVRRVPINRRSKPP